MPTEVIFTSSVLSMSSGLSSAAWTQPESKLSCIVLLAPWMEGRKDLPGEPDEPDVSPVGHDFTVIACFRCDPLDPPLDPPCDPPYPP